MQISTEQHKEYKSSLSSALYDVLYVGILTTMRAKIHNHVLVVVIYLMK